MQTPDWGALEAVDGVRLSWCVNLPSQTFPAVCEDVPRSRAWFALAVFWRFRDLDAHAKTSGVPLPTPSSKDLALCVCAPGLREGRLTPPLPFPHARNANVKPRPLPRCFSITARRCFPIHQQSVVLHFCPSLDHNSNTNSFSRFSSLPPSIFPPTATGTCGPTARSRRRSAWCPSARW
jgi:hypothetical protein